MTPELDAEYLQRLPQTRESGILRELELRRTSEYLLAPQAEGNIDTKPEVYGVDLEVDFVSTLQAILDDSLFV